MIMESDLHALKRLYGLLKKDGDDDTSTSATDLLDERARVLLKNLLDAATQRVLKEHSEIIAGTISATQLNQPDELSNKQQPTPLSKLSITAQGCQIREKEMVVSDKDRKVDGLDITLWKEQRFFPQSSQSGWVEQPVQSLLASGLEPKKKRCCRLCQRNIINHMEETHFYDDAQNSKRFTDMQHETGLLFNKTDESKSKTEMQRGPSVGNLNYIGFTDFSSETTKVCHSDIDNATKPEDVDCLSKEASEAIEQIELCISALHIRSDYLHMFEENPVQERINQPYWFLNQTSKLVQPTKTMSAQSANNFMSRGPALGSDWIMSHYDFLPNQIHNVQNFSAQLDPSETSYRTPTRTPTFSAASKMEGRYQSRMAMDDECSTRRLFQSYKPSGNFMYPNINCEKTQSVHSGQKVSSILRARGKNHPPNILRETLLDKKPSQILDFHGNESDAQHKDGIRKNRQYITARRTSLQKQESDGTATDSYSNSTTHQNNSRGSDGEEYSLTDQTGEYVTSSTWSESGASHQSYGTESEYNSYTGNIGDDVYSSSSSVADRELISSASSKSEGYSSYDHPIRRISRSTYSSISNKPGPRKSNGKKRKKQTGMWKRMKDKMAIIFHHHHHHHHHHHDDRGKNKTKMSHNSSLLKHKGKVINFNRQDEEAYGEKAVEKVKKSIIREKNQQSHFHGLMEGLLRHVRRSKPSKTGKETIRKLAKGQHGRQKTLKKSHWWKLLQHHRRRKLPNKTHVRLGLGKKKARLKALPSMN